MGKIQLKVRVVSRELIELSFGLITLLAERVHLKFVGRQSHFYWNVSKQIFDNPLRRSNS